jgi:hypothetical protein
VLGCGIEGSVGYRSSARGRLQMHAGCAPRCQPIGLCISKGTRSACLHSVGRESISEATPGCMMVMRGERIGSERLGLLCVRQ